jgi:hypothetical protein
MNVECETCLLCEQHLKLLQVFLLVQVDSVFRQLRHVVNVNLLLVQDPGHLGEELLEGPHPLRVDLQKSGQQRSHVFLDPGGEEAGGGELAVPLDRPVLTRLDS